MKNVFKKSDVKSGMLVKARNGMYFTVVDAMVTVDDEVGLAVVSDANNTYFPLDNYNDDLIFTNNLGVVARKPEFDIVKVWGHTYPKFAMDNNTCDRTPLWSRPETDDNAKKWDEMTDEEKDAICEKHDFCSGCPYEKECDADGEEDCKPDPTADVEAEVAKLLDELREERKDNPLAAMIFKALGGGLPEGYSDYVLGKTDKNPELAAPMGCGNKSLAEQLYEKDKELSDAGVSVLERDIALLTTMHSACGDHKE